MSMFTTARCRTAQALLRLGRKLQPSGKQEVETGAGAVFSVGQHVRDLRLKKPMVVLGAGETRARYKLLQALDNADIAYAVWDEMPAAPTTVDGEKLALAAVSQACDSLIALGDAALLDMVKAASAWCGYRGRAILELVGRQLTSRRMPPVIAVPTAGGSGAESFAGAAVMDIHGNRYELEGAALLPAVALLDPELLEDASREKTADAGMSGLCMAVEAYLAAPHGDARSKTQAGEAVELLLSSLEPCWNNGGSVRERGDILSASRLAGRAASAVGWGYIRALAGAAQSVCGVDVRTAFGVMLPAVLDKYGSAATDKLAQLAVLADASDGGSRAQRAEELIDRIRGMIFRMGLPDRLENVTTEQADEIGTLAAALANPGHVSPVVWTGEQCREVVRAVCVEPEEDTRE